jgi:hypothetical protein
MPWSLGNHLLLGRIVHRLASKQLCRRLELLLEFLVSSERIELSPLRKNKHNHCRNRSYTLTTLEMTTDIFRQFPWWIDEHTLPTNISLHDKVTRQTVR